MVVCLERGADLHMAQLMPLPLTVSCSSKIQIGFTILVPAYPGCPGKEAVKGLCVSYLAVKSYLAGSPGTVMKEYNEFSEWFLRTFSGAYEAVHFHTYLSCYLADPLFHTDFYRPFIQLSLNSYEFI